VLIGDHGIAHVQLFEVHAEGVLGGDVLLGALLVLLRERGDGAGVPWMAVRCR
jgi:hypothetical protein